MAESSEPKSPKALEAEVRDLIASTLDAAALRDRLDRLAREPSFAGLTPVWGPALYRRQRVLFRPFILAHFSAFLTVRDARRGDRWEQVAWSGATGRALDAWLDDVDRQGDVELFRRLYAWKHTKGRWGQLDEDRWRIDLLAAYRAVATTSQRNHVLAKFDLWGSLDDASATALYTLDPAAARPFILRHPPWKHSFWTGAGRGLCKDLMKRAAERGDDEFHYALYRKLVPLAQWEKEIRGLATTVKDPTELFAELEKRHPEGGWLNLANGFWGLVQARGRDVVPYLLKHVGDIRLGWHQGDYGRLLGLARTQGWWDLWAALLRTCARPEEFDKEILGLVRDFRLPERDVVARLLALAGVSREWNFGPFGLAAVHQLADDTAVALYDRFPVLLRGPYRMHVSGGWHGPFPKLVDRVLAKDDADLIDYLASRMIPRALSSYTKDLTPVVERLADYYQTLRHCSAEFAQRAATVLGQVPAYTLGRGYNEVIRTNRLARVFFERSAASLLDEPTVLRDLLEAPEIHVQALALRTLGLPDARARDLAARNLDLLEATLLRPLHRQTRALAFRALANGAASAEHAARILKRARQALDLPDKRYPKESLIGLLAEVLARWPELRQPREQPVVFAETAS